MTEVEGLQLLQVLLKTGGMHKRGLQFHDMVLKESRHLRRPVKGAAARSVSSVPVPKIAGKGVDDLATHTARNAAKSEKQAGLGRHVVKAIKKAVPKPMAGKLLRRGKKSVARGARAAAKGVAATRAASKMTKAYSVQLIGPGGDLSKLGTASSVPRDISQVSTDQRPPVAQEKANPVTKPKPPSANRNSLKVVL